MAHDRIYSDILCLKQTKSKDQLLAVVKGMTTGIIDQPIQILKLQQGIENLNESFSDDEGLIMSYLRDQYQRVICVKSFIQNYELVCEPALMFIDDCV